MDATKTLSPAPTVKTRTRLTRRGRQVRAVALALLLAAVITAAISFGTQAFAGDDGPIEITKVQVQPGDTLWGIAQLSAPRHDVRDAVAEIRRANHLSDGMVHPGEELIIPAHLLDA
ncbi:LysM peptidoglycan-binding domain-containing protein [Pseudoclavibacter sp. 13-3]|uniref:LysM peptidoglycan-binding domain-containing protein n=1 Tax=Pseudoclavibacter sp. 13-3 TaxID=2901228 RepID=UPI001E4207CE|nr:LysM peptidoglycan-binding domain-containing protein [Pseudoclavibacter sp. 13-3]MCD7102285.1 LysM peptidoglycan-binding domain-containing protein [Pseudoclavibacter sp. 13-3]